MVETLNKCTVTCKSYTNITISRKKTRKCINRFTG